MNTPEDGALELSKSAQNVVLKYRYYTFKHHHELIILPQFNVKQACVCINEKYRLMAALSTFLIIPLNRLRSALSTHPSIINSDECGAQVVVPAYQLLFNTQWHGFGGRVAAHYELN
ncbi:hypothetical protein Tsp_05782 [Trichinella spiralis]|uniref:hypothetical protein n=1 Tax=Trichinella spiralis TaxID=6334 RepID=UPI0001EFBFD2|nr:hypothetical protein Tsp_05782 [Trichinella spiralis]